MTAAKTTDSAAAQGLRLLKASVPNRVHTPLSQIIRALKKRQDSAELKRTFRQIVHDGCAVCTSTLFFFPREESLCPLDCCISAHSVMESAAVCCVVSGLAAAVDVHSCRLETRVTCVVRVRPYAKPDTNVFLFRRQGSRRNVYIKRLQSPLFAPHLRCL